MNQKTDGVSEEQLANGEEFVRGYLHSLIVVTLVVLAGVLTYEKGVEWLRFNVVRPYLREPPLVTLLPEMYASFKTLNDGIYLFSGKMLPLPGLVLKIGMLASAITAYVVIPTVFFFNWRTRRVDKKSYSLNSPLSISSIWYVLSIILIVSTAVTASTSAINNYRSYQKSVQKAPLDRESGKLGGEILRIALDAYQYRLLPKEAGGGNGSYEGFVLTPERTKNQNGIFKITTSEKQVTITAQSLLYSSGIIVATINEYGDWAGKTVLGVLHYED